MLRVHSDSSLPLPLPLHTARLPACPPRTDRPRSEPRGPKPTPNNLLAASAHSISKILAPRQHQNQNILLPRRCHPPDDINRHVPTAAQIPPSLCVCILQPLTTCSSQQSFGLVSYQTADNRVDTRNPAQPNQPATPSSSSLPRQQKRQNTHVTAQRSSTATMAERYIPEHRRTQFKAKNTFKPDELRRRREEQQVEIRKAKREENLAKRRGIGTGDNRPGASLGAAPDSEDENPPTESQVCCQRPSRNLSLALPSCAPLRSCICQLQHPRLSQAMVLLRAAFPAPCSIGLATPSHPSPRMNLALSKTCAHQQQPTFLGPLPMPVSTPASCEPCIVNHHNIPLQPLLQHTRLQLPFPPSCQSLHHSPGDASILTCNS